MLRQEEPVLPPAPLPTQLPIVCRVFQCYGCRLSAHDQDRRKEDEECKA